MKVNKKGREKKKKGESRDRLWMTYGTVRQLNLVLGWGRRSFQPEPQITRRTRGEKDSLEI